MGESGAVAKILGKDSNPLKEKAVELHALITSKLNVFDEALKNERDIDKYSAGWDEVYNPKLSRVRYAIHDLSIGNDPRLGLIDFYALAEESNRLRQFSPPSSVTGVKDEFSTVTVQAVRDFGKDLRTILTAFPKLTEAVFTGKITEQSQGITR